MRSKLGVWIGPPKVLLAPKPTSSVRINRTLGDPAGAWTPFGKSGTEPFSVRSIFPLKGGSGVGNTRGVSDAAARGRAVDATADAAMRDVEPSSRRRLISSLPAGDGVFDFLSDLSSLIVSSRLIPSLGWQQLVSATTLITVTARGTLGNRRPQGPSPI